jgi:hypothetical protein
VRGVLTFYAVFALIAAVAWIGFGRDAEKAVVDLGEGFTAIVLIISLPLLLVGLIAVPVHRWLVRKVGRPHFCTGSRSSEGLTYRCWRSQRDSHFRVTSLLDKVISASSAWNAVCPYGSKEFHTVSKRKCGHAE